MTTENETKSETETEIRTTSDVELEQLRAQIRAQNQIIRRLQGDLSEMPSLREYLKDLVPIHKACGQLVDHLLVLVPDPNDPRHKQARLVEKQLKTHGQR
jgi:hypothetical protein